MLSKIRTYTLKGRISYMLKKNQRTLRTHFQELIGHIPILMDFIFHLLPDRNGSLALSEEVILNSCLASYYRISIQHCSRLLSHFGLHAIFHHLLFILSNCCPFGPSQDESASILLPCNIKFLVYSLQLLFICNTMWFSTSFFLPVSSYFLKKEQDSQESFAPEFDINVCVTKMFMKAVSGRFKVAMQTVAFSQALFTRNIKMMLLIC